MKKFLAILLAVLMCCGIMASCSDKTEGPGLADALSYLKSLYKDSAKETPTDYDVVGKILINNTVEFTVTWESDNENVTVKESSRNGFFTIDVPDKTEAEIPYVLTATIKDADGNTETTTFEKVVPIVDNTAVVSAPEEGVEYALYLVHTSLGKTLYATHELQNNKFIVTTTDPKEAPAFFAEVVEGGYKFYTMIDDVKNYVTASVVKTEEGNYSKYINYGTEGSVWYYNTECNAWMTMVEGGEYVMGTYSSYTTICISESSYITPENSGVSQFPAVLIKKEAAENMGPAEEVEIYETAQDIVNEAYKLEAGAYLSGGHKYTLTGVITKVDSAYSAQYGNVTVTIVVDGMDDKPIQCFRASGDGADIIDVGNTITVTGPIVNYAKKDDSGNITSTIIEMEYPTLDSHDAVASDDPDDTSKPDGDTSEPENNDTPSEAPQNKTIKDILGIKEGSEPSYEVIVTGVVDEITNTTWGNMYIKDADGNKLLIYGLYDANGNTRYDAMAKKPAVGDTVTVQAPVSFFNGQVQLKNAKLEDLTSGGGSTTDPGDEPGDNPNDTPATGNTTPIADILKYTEGNAPTTEIFVSGTVVEVASTTWGNIYITDGKGNNLYLYGTYDEDGNRYDAFEVKPTKGDIIKVKGTISFFNGVPQIKNAVLVEHTVKEYEPGDPQNATIAEVLALTDFIDHPVIVTGTITKTYGENWATYGNFYITDGNGNELLIYGLYDENNTRYDKMDVQLEVGDTITVQSEVSFYNKVPQLKNATLLEVE